MNYGLIMRVSGCLDILLGISGGTIAIFYDVLMHRNFSLGVWAIATLIVCVLYVIKGMILIDFARD